MFAMPEERLKEHRIVLYGNRGILVEKHQGLFSYETHSIRVRLPNGILTVKGKELAISYFGVEDMQIDGKIESVQMDGEAQ